MKKSICFLATGLLLVTFSGCDRIHNAIKALTAEEPTATQEMSKSDPDGKPVIFDVDPDMDPEQTSKQDPEQGIVVQEKEDFTSTPIQKQSQVQKYHK